MRAEQLAREILDGGGTTDDLLVAFSSAVEDHPFTAPEMVASLAGATADALMILAGFVGALGQSLQLPGFDSQSMADSVGRTFNLAVSAGLYDIAFGGDDVDGEEE